MSLDNSSDFEQSPAKMFIGLFVLIAFLIGGFLFVRLMSNPNNEPDDPSSISSPLNSPLLDGMGRSPDGSLPGETFPDDPFPEPGFNSGEFSKGDDEFNKNNINDQRGNPPNRSAKSDDGEKGEN